MHYYQHHIGDLIKDTANLNDHQLATYLRMIWAYYSEEKPFANELEDIAFAMRTDEKTVGLLLRHYFKQTDEGWRHGRCDREIAEFNAKKLKAAASANARWSNAKNNTDAMRTQSERNASVSISNANQEPRTKNQEPIKQSMSGSPSANTDVVALEKQKSNKKILSDARTVLEYLNKNANKNFRDADSTLGPIVARLKEGYTAERLREIAFYKIEQWGTDEKMSEYLRPATLYNATKCAQYDGEIAA